MPADIASGLRTRSTAFRGYLGIALENGALPYGQQYAQSLPFPYTFSKVLDQLHVLGFAGKNGIELLVGCLEQAERRVLRSTRRHPRYRHPPRSPPQRLPTAARRESGYACHVDDTRKARPRSLLLSRVEVAHAII